MVPLHTTTTATAHLSVNEEKKMSANVVNVMKAMAINVGGGGRR